MATPPDRAPRSSVFLYARVEAEPQPLDCRVRNISEQGACIDNSIALTDGAHLHLSIGAVGHIEADVAWSKDERAGLHFHRSIDVAAARLPRAKAKAPTTGFAPAVSRSSAPADHAPPPAPPQEVHAGWMEHIRDPYRRK